MRACLALYLLALAVSSCSRADEEQPLILVRPDPVSTHFRGEEYLDAGADAIDNYTCDLSEGISTLNTVDIEKYGTYEVVYTVSDEAGNEAQAIREVDIVLPVEDYYSQNYEAHDTCTSGNYFYTDIVQDCNCGIFGATVANLSAFGLSASFTLPISGTYNEILILDTIKADVHFEGVGIMSPGAEMIKWQYSISDSVETDVCTSTWIRN